MIFSPIFRVELLTIARRRRYFLLRVLYALALLIAIRAAYPEIGHENDAGYIAVEAYTRFTRQFFGMFVAIQLCCILLLTPAMVAGTIASEYERRTIDYLLTTQLTDFEIALGKFSARLLLIGSLLLTSLPIVAAMTMLGGIGPKMILRAFWYELLTLIGVASLSLWISASTRRSRTAITTSYLALAVLVFPPLVLAFDRSLYGGAQGPIEIAFAALVAWNPIVLAVTIFEHPPGAIGEWATPLRAGIAYGTFSLVCIKGAVRALRRTYRKVDSRDLIEDDRLAKTVALPLRGRALGDSAMLWKELASQRLLGFGLIGRAVTALLFVAAFVGLVVAADATATQNLTSNVGLYGTTDVDAYGYHVPFRRTSLHDFSVGAGVVIGSLLLILITVRAAGSVTTEKEQDSWLTLLSTPLDGSSIVGAKIVGAIDAARYWYLFLVVTWCCCALRCPPFIYVVPLLAFMHLLLGCFCATVGVLFSVVCKNSLRASGASLLTVVGVGLGLPLLAMAILDWLDFTHTDSEIPTFFALPAMLVGWDEFVARSFDERKGYWDDSDHFRIVCLATATLTYAVVTPLLSWFACSQFDRLSGRVVPVVGERRPPPAPKLAKT